MNCPALPFYVNPIRGKNQPSFPLDNLDTGLTQSKIITMEDYETNKAKLALRIHNLFTNPFLTHNFYDTNQSANILSICCLLR